MIERWLVAIRDHPNRPPAHQRHVLTMLALRMDWTTGRGYVGTRDLMADADVCRNTVMRATSWARQEQLLMRTRRGHYINAQTTIASEWWLTRPQDQSQGLPTETLGQSQGLNGSHPKSLSGQPKVSVGTTHQESSTSMSSTSARGGRADAPRARQRHPCDTTALRPHSEACRHGDGKDCRIEWCECICHGRAAP